MSINILNNSVKNLDELVVDEINKQLKIQYNAMKKYARENGYTIEKSNFCLDDVINYFDVAYLASSSEKCTIK